MLRMGRHADQRVQKSSTSQIRTSGIGSHRHSVVAAIVRARNCDPLCSFGDFVAVYGEVNETAATYLKTEVSDGIIATG